MSNPVIYSPLPPSDDEKSGAEAYALVRELFPICRSITGAGVRETLQRLGTRLPLAVHEVPSGTPVLDWTVPDEWNIREAWIKGPDGRHVVDFRDCNLHVVSYSTPVRARMTLAELRPHLFSLPRSPDWIPYRTSYYTRSWGFCLADRVLAALPEGEYEVLIDATLAPGSLTYGECLLPGRTSDEVLVSCHVCHPSLANDNAAGLAVATRLAAILKQRPHRLTYRFVFVPGTIGSLTWLARNEDAIPRIRHGLLLTCAGDPGGITYKKSRRGAALVDRAAAHVLRVSGRAHRVIDFFPYGYDERQYCSPGYNLPLGCLMRTPHGEYPEYHTSADNLDLVTPAALADTLRVALDIVDILEHDRRMRSLNPKGEPQLGRRGLYRSVGGDKAMADLQMAYLWVMNLADGSHGLLDMAERASLPFATIAQAARDLEAAALLEEIS